MKRKPIKQFIKGPVVIPGIYNYCDSWCERCAFTQRCTNFAMRESIEEDTYQEEMDELTEMFKEDAEIEDENNDPINFDFDEDDIEEESFEERNLRREKVDEHELAILSQGYIDIAGDWLKQKKYLEDEIKKEVVETGQINRMKDDVEVIMWYLYQIHVKIVRALHGLVDRHLGDDDFQDSEGSAKVSLIGIDKSILAWQDLNERLPGNGRIPDFIMVLEELRTKLETDIPKARAFIRPGFDEVQN